MSTNTESNKYTLLFAIGMVVIVGSLLAFTASSLAPNIDVNKRLEKQQNILYAMGVNENEGSSATFVSTEKAPELFNQYITEQIIIQGGNINPMQKQGLIENYHFLLAKKKDRNTTSLPYLEKDFGMPFGPMLQWMKIW